MKKTYKYNPNRHNDWNYGGKNWKLSRSKIDFFLECPRCFYLDNVLGTKRPNFPPFNLNIAVDELWKREFDLFRKEQKAHHIISDNNLKAVPFQHQDLDSWRDPFVGITYLHSETNLLISGAVDDIWINDKKELLIVDYKATAKEGEIKSLKEISWSEQYVRQLSIYRWLLEKNDFKVNPVSYLLYANADLQRDRFESKLDFKINLIAVKTDIDWIDKTLYSIKDCLESDTLPEIGERCEFCPYRQASGQKLQKIYLEQKNKLSNI